MLVKSVLRRLTCRGKHVNFSDKTSKLTSISFSRQLPESSDHISSMDRLFSLKPALSNFENFEKEDYEGLPEPNDGFPAEGQYEPPVRLGKSILKLGKVHYRQTEGLSPEFKDRKDRICSYRTVPQIRRCLKDWMLESNRELQQEFRKLDVGWNDLSAKVTGSQKSLKKVYGPEETVAYAHYHMPSRYGILKRVFRELSHLLPAFAPSRVYDFGCGPATAAAAIRDTQAWTDSFKKYVGVDSSTSMLDAAKIMTQDTPGLSAVFWNRTMESIQRAQSQGDRYDLAVAAYTLSELHDQTSQQAAVQLLYELLDSNGLLVIVETGNPIGSHIVRSARQFLLDRFHSEPHDGKESVRLALKPPAGHRESDLSAVTIAPCTHDKPCPLGRGVWCSFAQKVRLSLSRARLMV